MRQAPWALLALAALGLSRLLPAEGVGLWLRLAFATLVVLAPGALVARALRQGGPSVTLAWGLGAVALALAAVLVVHASLGVALVVLALVAVAAAPFALARLPAPQLPGTVPVLLLGLLLGALLWHVSGPLQGDALFHVARVRKLDALGGLHLGSVDEFRDGGLHPGYAFPLWHGFLALVARLAGADPSAVVRHEPSLLAPLALGVVYEAGVRVFCSVTAGFAVLLAQVALIALAPGHGGSYVFLSLPPTAARQLLVPAAIALFFAASAGRGEPRYKLLLGSGAADWTRYAALAVLVLVLALVHVTYAVFLCIPLAGYLAARALLARKDLAREGLALAAVAVPTLVVSLWVRSIARTSASLTPDDAERRRALRHYASELDVFSLHRYRLAPEVLSRGGSVAVAALALVPLAAFSARRRWAALVLGGSAAVLALVLPAFVFPHFADLVSLSQARRAAGFLPFSFALAGGLAVLASLVGPWVLGAALGAGIGLELAWPGDFGYGLREGGPAAAAWVAFYGALAALVVGVLLRRSGELRGKGLVPLAAVLFVAPVAVHGFLHWSPRPHDARSDLTPGLVRALRGQVPRGDVVFADLETSYRIAAEAPVYVAASLPFHVADTRANRRFERVHDVRRFFSTGDRSILRRYGARWLVSRGRERGAGRRTYADARYVLSRLGRP